MPHRSGVALPTILLPAAVRAKMNSSEVGKVIELWLRCTDRVIAAYSRDDVAIADAVSINSMSNYNESMLAMHAVWTQLDNRMNSASDYSVKAACAKTWINAHFEKPLFKRIETLLTTVRDRSAVALSPSEPLTPR